MLRMHGTGHTGEDVGKRPQIDPRTGQRLRQFDGQAPHTPGLPVATSPLNLPALSDLPSFLPWGEGELAGREMRLSILDTIEETIGGALYALGKAGLPAPELAATDTVYQAQDKVLSALLAPIHKADEPGEVDFQDECAVVTCETMPAMFFNCDLDAIEECNEISEKRKLFLYRLASFVVRVNNVFYMPFDVPYIEESAQDFAHEVYGEEDYEPLIPLSESHSEHIDEIFKDTARMREAESRWGFVFDLDIDNLEEDLSSFDSEPEFRDKALTFLRAAKLLGSLSDHVIQEHDADYYEEGVLASSFFYVTPQRNNLVNDWFVGQLGDEAMNLGTLEFKVVVPYSKYHVASDESMTIMAVKSFMRLYADLLCNFGV